MGGCGVPVKWRWGRGDESASAFNSERGHIMTEVTAIVRDAAAERSE